MFQNIDFLHNFGLLVLRVGIGLLFIRHGYPKIMGGTQEWLWLGQQMGNLGITFAPMFWGFCAAASEFIGGIALVLGFCTRLAAALIAFVMFVAILKHYLAGEGFSGYGYALALFIPLVSLVIMGGGAFSIWK